MRFVQGDAIVRKTIGDPTSRGLVVCTVPVNQVPFDSDFRSLAEMINEGDIDLFESELDSEFPIPIIDTDPAYNLTKVSTGCKADKMRTYRK